MSYDESLRAVSFTGDSTVGVYTGVPGQPGSAVPNNGKQYCAVRLTGKDQVGLATAASQNIVGVLQNKPQTPGSAATVAIAGITNVLSGGAISAGAEITADSTGRFVAGASSGVGRRFIAVGIAAGAGELVPALMI